jgi:hypothetical protein
VTASDPGRRVRVTHPRTEAARRAPTRSVSREIHEQTELGELYTLALVKTQRRLAVVVCVTVALLLGGTALVGAWWPDFAHLRFAGIPVPWLLLGMVVYPLLFALGWFAVRQAERNEQAFVDLVRRR